MPNPVRRIRGALTFPLDFAAALLDDFAHRLLYATEVLDIVASHVDPDAIPGYRFGQADYEVAAQIIERSDREPTS